MGGRRRGLQSKRRYGQARPRESTVYSSCPPYHFVCSSSPSSSLHPPSSSCLASGRKLFMLSRRPHGKATCGVRAPSYLRGVGLGGRGFSTFPQSTCRQGGTVYMIAQ